MSPTEKYEHLKTRLLALADRLEIVASSCERTAITGLPGHLTSRDAWQGEGTYLRGEAEQCRRWLEEAEAPSVLGCRHAVIYVSTEPLSCVGCGITMRKNAVGAFVPVEP